MGTTLRADATSAPSDGTRRHVLLVEDDALIARAMHLRLGACGHHVSHAADIAQAANGLLDERPDVVVLDVNLPDGNGLGLAERMRRLRSTASVPLIVITASRDPDHRERASRLGVTFLEKPFAAKALLEAIERAPLQCLSRGSTQA